MSNKAPHKFTEFTDLFFTGKTVKKYFGKNGKFFTMGNPTVLIS